MMSLKAFLPQISRIFNSTPATLYERQRALVRLGVLDAADGRGPGSGVPLTADNLAALIIALGVTDNLSDTDQRVAKLCGASPAFKSTCPFTDAATFRGALAVVLGSIEKASKIEFLAINRDELSASIGYRSGRRSMHSPFQSNRNSAFKWPAISTQAMIHNGALKLTAGLLTNALTAEGAADE
jgi:hypothetical protein